MRTTDNNRGKELSELLFENEKYNIDDLRYIAGIDLQEDNPGLLVFPQSLGGIEESHVFSLFEKGESKKLITNNLMGFVGRSDTQLTICSRFAKERDNFMHYMLQKVFNINIFDFDQTINTDDIWDFMLYLFPYYLKKAYAQGLYKAYRKEQYNDANVKGTIDVKRHICINIPFAGKIAYNTREYSYDNPVTQLVRHTIEHIKQHPFGNGILNNDSETRDVVGKICFATQKHYNKNDRQKVIHLNLKPVTHPYFTEYKLLQKICLQILKYEKLTFGKEKDKVYGLLFDGAWLWEEYVAKVFEERKLGIKHKTTRDKLFTKDEVGKNQGIIPDFITYVNKPITASFVGDTKYKHIEKDNREDYFQIITYMYRYSSPTGCLIFPREEDYERERIIANGSGSKVIKLGLTIPQGQEIKNFSQFVPKMKEAEGELIKTLSDYLKNL